MRSRLNPPRLRQPTTTPGLREATALQVRLAARYGKWALLRQDPRLRP